MISALFHEFFFLECEFKMKIRMDNIWSRLRFIQGKSMVIKKGKYMRCFGLRDALEQEALKRCSSQ